MFHLRSIHSTYTISARLRIWNFRYPIEVLAKNIAIFVAGKRAITYFVLSWKVCCTVVTYLTREHIESPRLCQVSSIRQKGITLHWYSSLFDPLNFVSYRVVSHRSAHLQHGISRHDDGWRDSVDLDDGTSRRRRFEQRRGWNTQLQLLFRK